MVIFNSYVKLPEGNYHTCIMHHVDKGVLHVCGIDAKYRKIICIVHDACVQTLLRAFGVSVLFVCNCRFEDA